MNKLNFLFLISILFVTAVAAEDFRSASWGMSKEEITSLEKEGSITTTKMQDGSTILEVHDNILGNPATVTYMLIDNKLVQGTTAFFKLSLDGSDNNAKANLSRILDGLEKKYGGPKNVGPSPIGSKKVDWQTKDSDISLVIGHREDKTFCYGTILQQRTSSVKIEKSR